MISSMSGAMEKKKVKMGALKPWRLAKTVFFVFAMIVSFLFCATPLLVALLDVLLPACLFSSLKSSPLSPPLLSAELRSFSLRSSLVDVPLVSVARSLLILCAYGIFDGRGCYLGVATTTSVFSVAYVAFKSVYIFGVGSMQARLPIASAGKDAVMLDALFLSSFVLGMAHMVAAYRTSCRERRKLLVYRIDIEAVSGYKSDFTSYKKVAAIK